MELEFLHWLQGFRNDILDNIVLCITTLGDAGMMWIATGLLLMAVPAVGKETTEHVKMRRRMGICVLLALLVNFICGNLIIKNLVQRPRPFQADTSVIPLIYPGEYSFPSGHTSSAFAASCAIFMNHKKAGIVAFVMAAVMACTRLYLFVHYPTDILGGMILGIACSMIVCSLAKKKMRHPFFMDEV